MTRADPLLSGEDPQSVLDHPPGAVTPRPKRPFRRRKGSAASPLLLHAIAAGAIIGSGFGAFWLGWRGAAASLVPGVQMGYLAQAALAGFALLATGIGLLLTLVSKHLAARERLAIEEVQDRALSLLQNAVPRSTNQM